MRARLAAQFCAPAIAVLGMAAVATPVQAQEAAPPTEWVSYENNDWAGCKADAREEIVDLCFGLEDGTVHGAKDALMDGYESAEQEARDGSFIADADYIPGSADSPLTKVFNPTGAGVYIGEGEEEEGYTEDDDDDEKVVAAGSEVIREDEEGAARQYYGAYYSNHQDWKYQEANPEAPRDKPAGYGYGYAAW